MVYSMNHIGIGCEDVGNIPNEEDSFGNLQVYLVAFSVFMVLAGCYLVAVNSRLKKQVIHYQQQYKNVAAEKNEIEKKIDSLTQGVLKSEQAVRTSEDSKARQTKEIVSLRKQLKSSKIVVQKFEASLNTKTVEADRLRKQLIEEKKTLVSLLGCQKKIKELELKIAALESERSELIEINQQDTQKIKDLESLVKENREAHADLSHQISHLKFGSGEALLEINILSGKLNEAAAHIEQLTKEKEKNDELTKAVLVKLALLNGQRTKR